MSRYVAYYPTFWGSGAVCNVLTVVFTTYWRLTHFWFVHRMMHPWRTKWVPDIGKQLYKHVHSLHHKSYNPSTVRSALADLLNYFWLRCTAL